MNEMNEMSEIEINEMKDMNDKFVDVYVDESEDFADEEWEPDCVYPKEYRRNGIIEQIDILEDHFPGVGIIPNTEIIAEKTLPNGAEGLFAFLNWQMFSEDYEKSVEIILDKLKSTRRFHSYLKTPLETTLGQKLLTRHSKTEKMMNEAIAERAKSNILIMPAQFGMLHKGRSVRRVRAITKYGDFGLGVFEVGCMLLTHPNRLMSWSCNNLDIACAGDNYKFVDEEGETFLCAPKYAHNNGGLNLYTDYESSWIGNYDETFGSASAFVRNRRL